MTSDEQKRFQEAFFRAAGPNIEVLCSVFNTFYGTGFYITDAHDRLVAFSQQNIENCNVRNEADVIGKTCADLFPAVLADVYMARDRQVRQTGVPIINQTYTHSVDRSTDLRIVSVFPVRNRRGTIIGTVCVYRSAAAGDAVPDWYGRIRDIVAYIDAHYADKLELADLARIGNMSVSSFRRLFSTVMQTTPAKYLTTIRLNAARRLLVTTNKLITEIATETGFWDQSHFVKAFKAERGLTPSQYRRSHWAK